MNKMNKQQFINDLKTQYNENVSINDIVYYCFENDYFVVYMANNDVYIYNYDDNKIYFDCNDSENGIIRHFSSIYEMYHYMIDNNYDKQIIQYVFRHLMGYITNINHVILYDDMFEIYYDDNYLKSDTYYMDLIMK